LLSWAPAGMGKREHLPSPGKCRLLRVNYILVSTKRTKIVHWLEIYLNCNCGLHWGSLQRSPDILAGLERSAWQQRRKGRMEREGKGRGGEEGWREKEGRRHCPLLQEFPREPVIQNPLPLLFPGEIFWFHIQNMFKHEYGLLFNLASDDSCCQPSTTVVSPLVLSAVIYEVRRLESVVHNRPLY